jgi:hypothetical protein
LSAFSIPSFAIRVLDRLPFSINLVEVTDENGDPAGAGYTVEVFTSQAFTETVTTGVATAALDTGIVVLSGDAGPEAKQNFAVLLTAPSGEKTYVARGTIETERIP